MLALGLTLLNSFSPTAAGLHVFLLNEAAYGTSGCELSSSLNNTIIMTDDNNDVDNNGDKDDDADGDKELNDR